MKAKIRFAPLIRVSTESQQKKGESLKTQRQQIENYVKSLNGIIPESCWKYSGQEHATPDQERKKLEQLLKDSEKNIFDAVIVCDASRWSRDNERSKQGLKILKKNGIRFFVAATEYDLYSPEQSFFIGMATEIAEFQAKQQALKSIQNRIARARRGIPTGGKLPYGRTFDRESEQWGLDAEKVKKIEWAASQYLKGGKLPEIAKTLNMNASNLWRTLTKRAGSDWEIGFDSDKLDIHETVKIKIPALLPNESIKQIHARAASNKTYNHGFKKYKYLLARMIFCGHCGYAMFGQTNHQTKRYYRHPRNRDRVKQCDKLLYVPADDIEKAVLVHLFKMFGDVSNLQKAMKKAIPDLSKIKKLREQKTGFEKELEKTESKRQRIVKAIADGILNLKDARSQMDEIREREALLNQEIENINPQIENVPDEKQIMKKAALTKRTIEAIFGSYARLGKMSFRDKRKLCQTAFDGKDSEGNRLGVYVQKADDKITYTIKGAVMDVKGKLPISRKEVQRILEIDAEVGEQDIDSKCHAHYSVRVYQ